MDFRGDTIVEVTEIPDVADVIDVPLDEPMEIYKICKQMEICCDINHGIGLSAVQVGVPWKLFLVKLNTGSPLGSKDYGEYGYFINCEYEPVGDEKSASLEGCLSLKGAGQRTRLFQVERWNKVKMKGLRLTDNSQLELEEVDLELDESSQGVVFQHEIDHQRGILISELGSELFVW